MEGHCLKGDLFFSGFFSADVAFAAFLLLLPFCIAFAFADVLLLLLVCFVVFVLLVFTLFFGALFLF